MMRDFFMSGVLFEYEIHGENQANECRQVVPIQVLSLENEIGNHAEHDE